MIILPRVFATKPEISPVSVIDVIDQSVGKDYIYILGDIILLTV
jgi:hypothetical protein